jgi:hypothetical protein
MPPVTHSSDLRPGLLRWTAPHPGWEDSAEPESPADWPRDVGCVLYEAPQATVFIDPLVPDELWPVLDARVERRGMPVHVLTTVRWHERSGPAVLERYSGSTGPVEGVEPLELAELGETIFWIPEHGALVPGDRLIGDGRGGVRMCPQSWLRHLEGPTVDDLRDALQPALELPVELVLLSHGEPVLERAREALAAALR